MDEVETDLALQWYKDTLACLERNGFLRRGIDRWWHPTLAPDHSVDTLTAFLLALLQSGKDIDRRIGELKELKGSAN